MAVADCLEVKLINQLIDQSISQSIKQFKDTGFLKLGQVLLNDIDLPTHVLANHIMLPANMTAKKFTTIYKLHFLCYLTCSTAVEEKCSYVIPESLFDWIFKKGSSMHTHPIYQLQRFIILGILQLFFKFLQ